MALRRTRSPWFGPKRLAGWGWRVSSWQGWVVTTVVLSLIVAVRGAWGMGAWPVIVGLLIIYFVIIMVTGDPPGPPRRPGDRGDGSR